MVIKILPGNHKGIFSTESYEIGQWIYTFNPHYIEQPTRTSIQYNNKHFEDDMGQYLNHHCEPNTTIVSNNKHEIKQTDRGYVLKRGIHLIAIDIINKNEEITFDYNTTESKLTNPFRCKCHGNLIKGKDV